MLVDDLNRLAGWLPVISFSGSANILEAPNMGPHLSGDAHILTSDTASVWLVSDHTPQLCPLSQVGTKISGDRCSSLCLGHQAGSKP